MSAVIRLQPRGRKGRPYYKIVVMDKRKKLTSAFIEQLGTYNPVAHCDQNFTIDLEKTKQWMVKGAKPSETVARIIRQAEINPQAIEGTPKTQGNLTKANANKILAKQQQAKLAKIKAEEEAAAAEAAEEAAAADNATADKNTDA